MIFCYIKKLLQQDEGFWKKNTLNVPNSVIPLTPECNLSNSKPVIEDLSTS